MAGIAGQVDGLSLGSERPVSLSGVPETSLQGANAEEGRPMRAAARAVAAGSCACTGCQVHLLKQPRKPRGLCRPKKVESGRGKPVSKSIGSNTINNKGKPANREVMSAARVAQTREVRLQEVSVLPHAEEQLKLLNVTKSGKTGSQFQETSRHAPDNTRRSCEDEKNNCLNKTEDHACEGVKTTRQWAAWTHEEEECFFNALRSVGKNFEKITTRVEGKNKDQVRHYYYRTVKRLRKLVGPGFSLDPSNSREANGAMLRWWALMEKHSCTAANLRRSPKRLRKLVNLLEHQLLADRKKATKKLAQAANDTTPNGEMTGEKAVASAGSNIQEGVRKPATILQTSESASSMKIIAVSHQAKPGQALGNSKLDKKAFEKTAVKSTMKPGAKANSASDKKKSKVGRPLLSKDDAPKIVEQIVEVPPRKRKNIKKTESSAEEMEWEAAASIGVALMAEAAAQLEKACDVQPQAPGTPRAIDQGAAVITFDGSRMQRQVEDGKGKSDGVPVDHATSPATVLDAPLVAPINSESIRDADQSNISRANSAFEKHGSTVRSQLFELFREDEEAFCSASKAQPCRSPHGLDDARTSSDPSSGFAEPADEAPTAFHSPSPVCTAHSARIHPCSLSSPTSAGLPASQPSLPTCTTMSDGSVPLATSSEMHPIQEQEHASAEPVNVTPSARNTAPSSAKTGTEGQQQSPEAQFPEVGTGEPADRCAVGTAENTAGGLAPTKLKLQLFPVDDCTRATLQKEGHNPYLELTLKARKSVAAVVQHLNAKWKGSQAACGELRLLCFHRPNMEAEQSWGVENVNVTIEEIKAAVGASGVFRLRYSWRPVKGKQQEGEALTSGPASTRPSKTPAVPQYGSAHGHGGQSCQPDLPYETTMVGEGKVQQRQSETSADCGVWRGSFPDAGMAAPRRTAADAARHFSSCSLQYGSGPEQVHPRVPYGVPWAAFSPSSTCQNQKLRDSQEAFGATHFFAAVQASTPPPLSTSALSQDCPSWAFEESRDGFGRRSWSDQSPEQSHFLTTQGRMRSSSMGGAAGDMAWVDNVTNVSMSDLLLCDNSRLPSGLGAPSGSPAMQLWGMEDTRDAFGSTRPATASPCRPSRLASEEAPAFSSFEGSLQGRLGRLPVAADSSPALDRTRQEAMACDREEGPSMPVAGASFEAEAEHTEEREPKSADALREDLFFDTFWTNSLGSMGIALPQAETGADLSFGGEGSVSIGGLISSFRTPSTDGFAAAIAAQSHDREGSRAERAWVAA